MLSKEAALKMSKCLVACNVYISAGSPQHAAFLLQLLDEAQQLCRLDNNKIAIVHAFADGPYDRSSFHLAGSPCSVARVATQLATHAVRSLSSLRQQTHTASGGSIPHPTVGLVDHVAVLPLANNGPPLTLNEWNEASHGLAVTLSSKKQPDTLPSATLASGWVARAIGHGMDSSGVNVFFYGHAHAQQTPLATVRRESTQFFRSMPSTTTHGLLGQATVGASPFFVENYNVRLISSSEGNNKSLAQSLTKRLRTRDGGLPFVEALTLPYSQNRYEVACNLLNPDETCSGDIDASVQTWERSHLIESSYRVGTTTQQCLEALEQTSTAKGKEGYDQRVRERLEEYLNYPSASRNI